MIETKGRARQKAYTLARKAGVDLKAVCFTKKEVEEAIGYQLKGRICTKRDTAYGRAFQSSKVIWLSLPTTVATIAEEIIHLATRTSHSNYRFKNKVVALTRGYAPAKTKARWFEVTITSTAVYKVWELTPADAKKRYRRGDLLKHEEKRTARSINP